jgi:hypothetical protein
MQSPIGGLYIFTTFDSPSFRTSLLLVTAVIACGLGVSSIRWAKDRFKVMYLSLEVPGLNVPGFPVRQTLVLTPKDLEIGTADRIQVYTTVPETWITMKGPKDEFVPRVIGIAPPPTRFKLRGLNIGLYRGTPLATIWTPAEVAQERRNLQESAQSGRKNLQILCENPSQLNLEQIAQLVQRQRMGQ